MMRSIVVGVRTWTSDDYVALLETCVLAVVVEIALRIVPLSTILAAQARIGRHRDREVDAPARERLAQFAARPYRAFARRGTCLRRSLLLATLLRRRGVPARVCFGVDRPGGLLSAHAWVTVDDVPIGEGDRRFHELLGVRPWSV